MKNSIIRESSIFFSDIVGYSSMIARNEKAALQLLDEHDIILETHIKKNNGNIIKHIGDAIFAEFSNSDSAKQAAIDIQNELKHRNKISRGKDQIVVRIGLHYGNVVVKGNDLFGNDVNLCARIEPTAIPGGIAVSDSFLSTISNNDIYKRSYGHVKLKNMPKSTELFRIYIDKKDYLEENQDKLIKTLISRGIKIVEPDEIFDNYHTIAVLYPENLGEKEEDFFCYEFLDQIINDLKKIDKIRTPSIFDIKKYKGSQESISQISIDLAVQNIVQLSILSVGDSFKVNILFTSMSSGEQILKKTWDGKHNKLKNISGKIISEFADKFSINLSSSIKELFNVGNKINNKAYKKFLEGKYLYDTMKDADSINKSEKILKEAIEIDDEFAEAHAILALTYIVTGEFEDAEEELEEALDIAEEQDNQNALALINNCFGIYYRDQKRFKKAIKYIERGIKLQKTLHDDYMHAKLLHNLAACYSIIGEPDKALSYSIQSQAIYEKLEQNTSLGNSYGEMANIYKRQSKHQEAIKYYDKAKQIFISENMQFKFAWVLILQSEEYKDLKDFKIARKNLDEASEISKAFNNLQMNGRIYSAYAQICIEEGKIDDALDYLDDALDIFMDMNNKLRSSHILAMMGSLYLEKNKIKKAEKLYDRAKKLLSRIDGVYSTSEELTILKEAIEEKKLA